MRKLLSCLALLCLALLATCQAIDLKNPLPKGGIAVRNKALHAGTKEVFLYGVNVSWDAITALPPVEFAKLMLSRGFNWIRFHKIKDGIDIYPYVDALYNVGIVSSVDILLADDAVSFYEGNAGTRAKFTARVESMRQVLNHRGMFLACLINEGATPMRGRPNLIANLMSGYNFGKAALQKVGFKGLVGDVPDANIDTEMFAPAVKQQDVALAHGYGIHPQGLRYQEPLWSANAHFSGVSYWMMGLTGKQLLWQEIACLLPDQRRHINEVHHMAEAIKMKASGVCAFQWASNHAQMGGKNGDNMSMATDYPRLVASIANALQLKHKPGLLSPNPTSTVNLGEWGGNAVFEVSAKKRIVVLLETVRTNGFASHDVGGGWKQIDSWGDTRMWHLDGPNLNLGDVEKIERINPFTLQVEATVKTFDRACGVYNVYLK